MTDSEICECFHSLVEEIDYSIDEILDDFYDSETGFCLSIHEHEQYLKKCKTVITNNRVIHKKLYELYSKLLEKDILNDLIENIIGFSFSYEMSNWYTMKSIESSLKVRKNKEK